jgi:hypothetical protein
LASLRITAQPLSAIVATTSPHLLSVAGFAAATNLFSHGRLHCYGGINASSTVGGPLRLWLHLHNKSAMYQHMDGVAGLAAAMDYFYFATNSFISCADNFVSATVSFVAMAEYFLVAVYNFESAMDNTDYAQTAKSLFIFYICL